MLSWLYFLAATLLLRRCNFGIFPSLLIGSALATGGLQGIAGKLAESYALCFRTFGLEVLETRFPNLAELPIYGKRIPRPIVTELMVVLLMAILIKLWREPRLPSFAGGLAIGALFALLIQGDPCSVPTLGLVFTVGAARIVFVNRYKIPWRLVAGGCAGAILFG